MSDLERLAKEISTMLSFKHTNVMSLIGVCIDGEMPLLIMPFMSNGSVLDFVRCHKDELLLTINAMQQEVVLACIVFYNAYELYLYNRSGQLVRLYLAYVIKLQRE